MYCVPLPVKVAVLYTSGSFRTSGSRKLILRLTRWDDTSKQELHTPRDTKTCHVQFPVTHDTDTFCNLLGSSDPKPSNSAALIAKSGEVETTG